MVHLRRLDVCVLGARRVCFVHVWVPLAQGSGRDSRCGSWPAMCVGAGCPVCALEAPHKCSWHGVCALGASGCSWHVVYNLYLGFGAKQENDSWSSNQFVLVIHDYFLLL